MDNRKDIPKPIMNDMLELFGTEKTDRILANRLIDFRIILILIMREKFIVKYEVRPEIPVLIAVAIITLLCILF